MGSDMRRKTGIFYGIIMASMAMIIIIGRFTLIPAKEDVDNVQAQWIGTEEMQGDVDKIKYSSNIFLIHQDVFQEQLNGVSGDEDTLEEAIGEEELEESVDFDAIIALREAEAIEALNIKNPDLQVFASAAVLMDATTKEILYQKNALEEIQPASTAKLLTAIVAVECSDEDEEFVVGSEIGLMASDSSRAYLSKGQVLSLSQILDALLLPSGNDAAYTIAANLGRKIAGDQSLKAKTAVKEFLRVMNETAFELGAVHSNFATPDGYDAKGQYTTAYDMALIGAKAIQYDEIRTTVVKEKARDLLLSGEDVTWYNSNKLIKPGSGYYYKYAIGLKTGTSEEAGRCLISAADKENSVYVSVVMDASSDGRWQDSLNLLRYGIEQ